MLSVAKSTIARTYRTLSNLTQKIIISRFKNLKMFIYERTIAQPTYMSRLVIRIAKCKKRFICELLAPLDSDIKLNFCYLEKKRKMRGFLLLYKTPHSILYRIQKDLPLVLIR